MNKKIRKEVSKMKKIVTIIVSFAFILTAMCTGVSAMEIS